MRWRKEGRRISTSGVESTVDRLLGRRLDTGQRMCWTKRGAHLLLQVRCAVLHSEFLQRYRRWFPSVGTRSIGHAEDAQANLRDIVALLRSELSDFDAL